MTDTTTEQIKTNVYLREILEQLREIKRLLEETRK